MKPFLILPEVAIVVGVVTLLRRWSAPDRAWTDIHRLALLVSMLVGFFFVTAGDRIDQIGQGAASIVAIALLALFARRLQRRGHVMAGAMPQHA
jgi:hypothetical protein